MSELVQFGSLTEMETLLRAGMELKFELALTRKYSLVALFSLPPWDGCGRV